MNCGRPKLYECHEYICFYLSTVPNIDACIACTVHESVELHVEIQLKVTAYKATNQSLIWCSTTLSEASFCSQVGAIIPSTSHCCHNHHRSRSFTVWFRSCSRPKMQTTVYSRVVGTYDTRLCKAHKVYLFAFKHETRFHLFIFLLSQVLYSSFPGKF